MNETSGSASWIPYDGDKTSWAWIPWRGTQNPRVTSATEASFHDALKTFQLLCMRLTIKPHGHQGDESENDARPERTRHEDNGCHHHTTTPPLIARE